MASYKELLAQRDALNKQIADARKVELADAIKQVKALIEEYELTAADCGFTMKTTDATATTGTRAPQLSRSTSLLMVQRPGLVVVALPKNSKR